MDQTASCTDENSRRISPFNYSKSNTGHMEAVSRERESEQEAGKEEKNGEDDVGEPSQQYNVSLLCLQGLKRWYIIK